MDRIRDMIKIRTGRERRFVEREEFDDYELEQSRNTLLLLKRLISDNGLT
jgi:hypothetical protein